MLSAKHTEHSRSILVVCRRLLLVALVICSCSFLVAPGSAPLSSTLVWRPSSVSGINLPQRLDCFNPLVSSSTYRISLCADVPVNDRPGKVYYKQETGHVFIILQKIFPDSTQSPVAQVFGFYPRRPASSIIFKNVKCEILDNGEREYNAIVFKDITAEEFGMVMQKAKELTARKYNINKYNCYDYALEVFNSIPGIEKLPVKHIRFPFPFGRGGSPCGLYRDLQQLKAGGSAWAPSIRFGVFTSPASYIQE